MFKEQKGITLVALVITIIVLLILAGVTISMVLNGGIIDKAQEGVQTYSDSAVREQIDLGMAVIQADYYNPQATTSNASALTQFKSHVESTLKGAVVSDSAPASAITVTYNKKVWSVNIDVDNPTDKLFTVEGPTPESSTGNQDNTTTP